MEKIDIIITYVDCEDKEWVTCYEKFSNKKIDRDRYHQNGTLKYVLRSIERCIPFVNNIFLVVSSDSQIPNYINEKTVKIVKHEDFIPQKFLPTFNSICIEQFLHLIPNLNEKYVYVNDDCIILNKLSYTDLYDNETPRYMFHKDFINIPYRKFLYETQLIEAYNYVFQTYPKDFIPYPFHNIQPRTIKYSEKLYNDNKDIILECNTTKFRDKKNLPIHYFYWFKIGMVSEMKINQNFCRAFTYDDCINIEKLLNSEEKLICINEIGEKYEKNIIYLLENKFKEKSKYEK